MKRSFPEDHDDHNQSIAMANCLVLLSQGVNLQTMGEDNFKNTNPNRLFECKTCNRKFPSFQALGGHRASHKKPRLTSISRGTNGQDHPVKPKTHECSICGLEFAIGQALGGHMRRHRSENQTDNSNNKKSTSGNDDSKEFPFVKKSNSRRILCLDLNLTPFENDVEMFKTQKLATIVDFIL